MANEPNNAEEHLKQYAEERRQHVPPEIHPATQRILQGEVARTYGSPAEERRARLGIRFLKAFAWLAILAVIPLFLLPRNPATRDELPGRQKEVPLPTAAPAGQSSIILSDNAAPVPTPEAAAAARDEAKTAGRARLAILEKDQTAEKKLEAPAAPATKATAETSQLLFNNNSGNPPVLKRFQMQQTGQTLTFVDDDQSVYAGRVLSQQGDADNFSAAGLNRTLNTRVVFTGQVVRAQAPVALQQQALSANNAQNVNNAAQNISVQGQAQIGNSQIKVDAQLEPAR